MHACYNDNVKMTHLLEIVRLLLQARADKDAKDRHLGHGWVACLRF